MLSLRSVYAYSSCSDVYYMVRVQSIPRVNWYMFYLGGGKTAKERVEYQMQIF